MPSPATPTYPHAEQEEEEAPTPHRGGDMNTPPEAQAGIRRSAPVIAGGVAGASVIALLAVRGSG